MAIDDDKAKAVKVIEDYTMRYYGRLRTAVEPVSIVGSPDQCVEKSNTFFSKGPNTLIIGVANPDPRQLDLFGEKVLPKFKAQENQSGREKAFQCNHARLNPGGASRSV